MRTLLYMQSASENLRRMKNAFPRFTCCLPAISSAICHSPRLKSKTTTKMLATRLASISRAASKRVPFAFSRSFAAVLPDLPYAYDALEPHIDAETMEIHHSKHHNACVRAYVQKRAFFFSFHVNWIL